jgi:hypothetical protein
MFEPSHLHCPRCLRKRPLRFAPLLAHEPSLGTAASCAACGFVVFTLVAGAKAFCGSCDAFAGVRLEASVVDGTAFVCCSECAQMLAMLCGEFPYDVHGSAHSGRAR